MYVFIGGPPTAGKSHLAQEFAENSNLGILHISTDQIRKEINNPDLKKWVDFFRNQDEYEYWKNNSPEGHVKNFISQAKYLWPSILKEIERITDSHEHAIFEGVSILPELARRDLKFSGFFIVPNDTETIYNRLLAHSRWGESSDLKRLEANAFFEGDTKFYKKSAKEYGYQVFDEIERASQELVKYFG